VKSPDQATPIIWRTPPWLAAVLYLLTAALLAAALYLNFALTFRVIVGAIAVVFGLTATFAARLLLYADSEGLVVRRIRGETSLTWPEVATIDVVRTGKTGMTLAMNLTEGGQILVPPSLVLPAWPHGLVSTRILLKAKASQLGTLGQLDLR
jgi:hypothetical protein